VIAMHATQSPLSALCLLAALGAAACAPSAPANPSWEADVKPILAANCVRCHRDPAQNYAPSTFRFDICEDAGTILGAAAQAQRIVVRGSLEGATAMPPPPAAPLSDRQIETIENWIANGTPCTGTAAAAPSFVLLRPVEESLEESIEESLQPGVAPGEHQLALRYTIEDAAGALVSATVVAVAASGETYVAPEPLRAGTGELVWSLGVMPAGTYEVLVTLDDGAEIREVRIGTFAIAR
jgi:cytochrome c553